MSFLGFNSTYYCKGKVRKFISISNSTEQKTKESPSLTRRILQSAAARGRVQVVQPRSEWTSSCASSARATVPPCHRVPRSHRHRTTVPTCQRATTSCRHRAPPGQDSWQAANSRSSPLLRSLQLPFHQLCAKAAAT